MKKPLQSMSSRKGITNIMIGVISGIIVVLVLIMVFGKLVPVMKGASKSKICQYNLFITAATKTPGIHSINIPPECEMKRITYNYTDLKRSMNKAKRDIRNYNEDYGEKYGEFSYDPENEDDLVKYELDRKIGKEIKACWDTGWKGNINFFDEWWKFYTFGWEETDKEKNILEKFFGEFNRAPVNCIACARIKFDNDLQQRYAKEYLESVNEWMKKTPVPGDPESTSYWEYTLSSLDDENLYSAGERFSYRVDRPYLITFTRINSHKGGNTAKWLASKLPWFSEYDGPEDYSSVVLIPYDEVSDYCSLLIG